MAKPMKIVPQPPIDRIGRPSEAKSGWIGLAVAGVGVALLAVGLLVTYAAQGGPDLRQWQIVQLATHGGIERVSATASKPASGPASSPTKGPALKITQGQADCPT